MRDVRMCTLLQNFTSIPLSIVLYIINLIKSTCLPFKNFNLWYPPQISILISWTPALITIHFKTLSNQQKISSQFHTLKKYDSTCFTQNHHLTPLKNQLDLSTLRVMKLIYVVACCTQRAGKPHVLITRCSQLWLCVCQLSMR